MNYSLVGKATHVALHPGIVQHKGAMLATLALDGSDHLDGFALTPRGNEYRSLATNVVLPRDADGWVLRFDGNGTVVDDWAPPPADAAEPFALRGLPSNGSFTLALRVQQGALAIRVFALDGAGGRHPPGLSLRGEPLGLSLGAIRLAAYHFGGPDAVQPLTNLTSAADTHIRFGALLLADAANSTAALRSLARRAAAAKITSSVDARTGVWTASAELAGEAVGVAAAPPPTVLAVQRNLTCSETAALVRNQSVHSRWNCLVSRTVNGADVVPGPLTVNGKVFASV